MSEKGKELYEEIKQKLEKLEDKESKYWKFTELWRLGCQAKVDLARQPVPTGLEQ